MEQELIEFLKKSIDEMKWTDEVFKNTIYKSQIKIFFNQFDSLIESKEIQEKKFYQLVKDQVLNNLFSFQSFFEKEIVKNFLDQIVSTNNFIKQYEKNN